MVPLALPFSVITVGPMVSEARSRPRAKFHRHGLKPGYMQTPNNSVPLALLPMSHATLPSLAIGSHDPQRGCSQLPGSRSYILLLSTLTSGLLLSSDFLHTESRLAWPPSMRTLLARAPCPFCICPQWAFCSPRGRHRPLFLLHTSTLSHLPPALLNCLHGPCPRDFKAGGSG